MTKGLGVFELCDAKEGRTEGVNKGEAKEENRKRLGNVTSELQILSYMKYSCTP